MSVWWDKKFIENFYNYYILLKSYVNLLPLSLTLKLTQDNVSWRKSFSISPFIRWIKGYLVFLFFFFFLVFMRNCNWSQTVQKNQNSGGVLLGVLRLMVWGYVGCQVDLSLICVYQAFVRNSGKSHRSQLRTVLYRFKFRHIFFSSLVVLDERR